MPLEMDYEFGKRAVSAGRLTQDQLEECVEVLVALERVGSKQRLWQVIQRKGYMTEPAVAEVRASVEGAAPASPPAAPKVPAAPKEAAAAEETAEDLDLPLRHVRGSVLAHLHKGGQAKLYPLPTRVVTLGRNINCDIMLSDPGVLDLHARVNFLKDGYAIEEAVPGRGVVVNDQRVRARKLTPCDLIELGSALLLFLPDYGDQLAAEPMNAASAGAAPSAQFRVTDGARKGAAFFLGSTPLVIGRHTLANVRLKESAVAEFQTQIAQTPQGIRLVDLLSLSGTKVNGIRVSRQYLNEGDNISIGPVTLAFHVLVPAAAGKRHAPATPAVEPKPAPAPKRKGELDWDIAAEVEVEAPVDPFMRRGTETPSEGPIVRVPVKVFKPGELRLACIEGPLVGKRFVISKNRMLIGRDEGLDLVIPDGSVSRQHAEIILGPKKAEVKDLSSRNGVYVNGARAPVAPIRPGDTIRIHQSLFVVEEIPPRPRPRKP